MVSAATGPPAEPRASGARAGSESEIPPDLIPQPGSGYPPEPYPPRDRIPQDLRSMCNPQGHGKLAALMGSAGQHSRFGLLPANTSTPGQGLGLTFRRVSPARMRGRSRERRSRTEALPTPEAGSFHADRAPTRRPCGRPPVGPTAAWMCALLGLYDPLSDQPELRIPCRAARPMWVGATGRSPLRLIGALAVARASHERYQSARFIPVPTAASPVLTRHRATRGRATAGRPCGGLDVRATRPV